MCELDVGTQTLSEVTEELLVKKLTPRLLKESSPDLTNSKKGEKINYIYVKKTKKAREGRRREMCVWQHVRVFFCGHFVVP